MYTGDMESITDLFGKYRLMKPGGKTLDERATLIKYFHERARDKEGQLFEVSYIGMRLSHLKVNDLYYLKSICESESKRGSIWNKVFFGSISTPKTR